MNVSKWALALALAGSAAQSQAQAPAGGDAVPIARFGALPDDGQNDAAALRKALDHARANPGTTLTFAPGVYNFRDEAAVALMDKAMAGGLGKTPEKVIFTPYYPYVKGLDLENVQGLTIEAKGAEILFEGWMEPVSLVGARDITIKGLTIDYKRRALSEGTVTAIGDGFFDADVRANEPINPDMPLTRAVYWDKEAHRMTGDPGVSRFEILGPQKIRVWISKGRALPKPGNAVGLMHSAHFRPAILVRESDNVRLDGVTIHSQPGMGIVAHRCNNLTLSGVRIVPPPGSYFSTTTDATHLTSCTGLIRYENSIFENPGDDIINVHNYYWPAARTKRRDHYVISAPQYMHSAVLDHPDVGARLQVVRASTLEPVGIVTVKSVVPHKETMKVDVELEGELPKDLDNYLLSDVTRLPRVELVGNFFLSHRARGALIKTHNVLIERNLILHNSGTGVHVAAEGGWREGIPSANVTIRGNRFIGNGYGGGTIHGTSAIAVNIDADEQAGPLHHKLVIEDNIIDGDGAERCIWISQARDVRIRFNRIAGCKDPIALERSDAVELDRNWGPSGEIVAVGSGSAPVAANRGEIFTAASAARDRFGRVIALGGKQQVPCRTQSGRTAVLLTIGQSNGANTSQQKFETKQGTRVLNWFGGRCYLASSPLLGTENRHGETWTLLGDKLIEAGLYDQVILAPSSIGGTEVARWQAGGDLNHMLMEVLEKLQPTYKPTHVLWHQGENDLGGGTSAGDYAAGLRSLVTSLRGAGVDAPFFVSVASKCGRGWDAEGRPERDAIAEAQRAVVDPAQGIYAGIDSNSLIPPALRYDRCHFSAAGQEKFASGWLDIIRAHAGR